MVHNTRPVSQLCTVTSYNEMPRNRNMIISATLLHNERVGGGEEGERRGRRERGRGRGREKNREDEEEERERERRREEEEEGKE